MLSPTHEEEITTLVASTLKSYKDVPLRLYQISKTPAAAAASAKSPLTTSLQLESIVTKSDLGMACYGHESFL